MDIKTYLQANNISNSQFAERIGVSGALVWQWRSGHRPIPVERCAAIEKATDGLVSRKDLRPDDWRVIWPEIDK